MIASPVKKLPLLTITFFSSNLSKLQKVQLFLDEKTTVELSLAALNSQTKSFDIFFKEDIWITHHVHVLLHCYFAGF